MRFSSRPVWRHHPVSAFWTARRGGRSAAVLLFILLGAGFAGTAYGGEADSLRPDPLPSVPFRFGEVAARGLGEDLLGRMEREARHTSNILPADLGETSAPADPVAEQIRAREAERILTRAVDRTLEGRLDLLGRTVPGVRAAVTWLENFGRLRGGDAERTIDSRRVTGGGEGGSDPSDFRARFGLRLDAHPRLILASRMAGFQSRLEVPLLGEPPRLSIERSFGAGNHAVLSSGLERGGRAWASIGLSLSY